MFKEYQDYINDNPKGYWFKAKIYGWGWTPVTWQGWVATFVYVLLLVALASTLDTDSPTKETALMFLIPFAILTTSFIRLCYAKGEKPEWRWGIPKKK